MTRTQAEDRYSCYIDGLDCPDCASKIENQISRLPGVKEARISVIDSRLDVKFEDDSGGPGEIEEAIKSLGYGLNRKGDHAGDVAPRFHLSTRTRWILTSLSGLFILTGLACKLLAFPDQFEKLSYLIAIVLSGPPIFKKGLLATWNRNLDMNFLMSVAVIGAISIGEWIEGTAVIFLFSLANLLESHTISKARKAIEALMDLTPKVANLRRNGTEVAVPVEEVEVGELVLVRPGEKIPVDGRIVTGTSNVDQSTITGESVPVMKSEGSQVFAGTINGRGFLEIEAEKKSEDTTLSRILHMVEEAQVQKAPAQRSVDRFSLVYTPIVVIAAIAVAVVPPLVFNLQLDVWLYRALVLLVVACPCALVISTPVTIISGLTSAARQGILIKGGAFLELTSQLKVIAFDKTGTVTYGRPEVVGVQCYNAATTELDILRLAASLELRSEHPLAEAILKTGSK